MPTYVTLVNWTDQGLRTVKDTVSRARAGTALAERIGGKVNDVYWTIGPYDIVVVSDFPDGETAEAFALAIGSQGNIRTTTLRAFTSDEMTGVLAKLD